jgi:hypothetical protein
MDFYHATAELTISTQSGIANPYALLAPRQTYPLFETRRQASRLTFQKYERGIPHNQ